MSKRTVWIIEGTSRQGEEEIAIYVRRRPKATFSGKVNWFTPWRDGARPFKAADEAARALKMGRAGDDVRWQTCRVVAVAVES